VKRALLVFALLAFARPAPALMLEVPLDRLAAGSDAVVRAKVMEMESRWTDDRTTIVTDVTFSIVESWAGDLVVGSRMVIQVEGGEVGDLGVRVEHQPVFRPGEETVLFLKATPSARYRINALEQGKFTVLSDQVMGFRGENLPLVTLRATVRSLAPARSR